MTVDVVTRNLSIVSNACAMKIPGKTVFIGSNKFTIIVASFLILIDGFRILVENFKKQIKGTNRGGQIRKSETIQKDENWISKKIERRRWWQKDASKLFSRVSEGKHEENKQKNKNKNKTNERNTRFFVEKFLTLILDLIFNARFKFGDKRPLSTHL